MHIQEVLRPSMTLVAAWHHGEIPDLVSSGVHSRCFPPPFIVCYQLTYRSCTLK